MPRDAIDIWNDLFTRKALAWEPVPDALPNTTMTYLALVRGPGRNGEAAVGLEMATQSPIMGTYLFRVSGLPLVEYLLHDPAYPGGAHIWCDLAFNNVDPEIVGWIVAARASGIPVQIHDPDDTGVKA